MKNLQILGTGCQKCEKLKDLSEKAAKELGADISAHRSRPYNPYMADDTELFVCMTPAHAAHLMGAPAEKIMILAGGIPDPYGGDIQEYRECAKKISEGLEELLKSVLSL